MYYLYIPVLKNLPPCTRSKNPAFKAAQETTLLIRILDKLHAAEKIL